MLTLNRAKRFQTATQQTMKNRTTKTMANRNNRRAVRSSKDKSTYEADIREDFKDVRLDFKELRTELSNKLDKTNEKLDTWKNVFDH